MTNSINKIRKVFAACTAACMACLSVPQGTMLAAETEKPDFSVLGAVGVFTEEETEKIASLIYEGLENHEERIDLNGSGMPQISVLKCISSLGSDTSRDGLTSSYNRVIKSFTGTFPERTQAFSQVASQLMQGFSFGRLAAATFSLSNHMLLRSLSGSSLGHAVLQGAS